MTERAFLDTNLLIYYYSEDEPEKSDIVKRILLSNEIVISTQTINEFSNVMLRKFKKKPTLIKSIISEWGENFEIITLTPKLSIHALSIYSRYKFSFWDSLIVVTAIESNCNTLFSEDLQHKQLIEKRLRVFNPFDNSDTAPATH